MNGGTPPSDGGVGLLDRAAGELRDDLRREVLRAPLDGAQRGLGLLGLALRAQGVEAGQVEMLVVDRMGQLVRQREALRQVRERGVADVDQLAVIGVVEADDLAGLELQERLADVGVRRDHAQGPPRERATRIERRGIRRVERRRHLRVHLGRGDRLHGHGMVIRKPADALHLLLHLGDGGRRRAPRHGLRRAALGRHAQAAHRSLGAAGSALGPGGDRRHGPHHRGTSRRRRGAADRAGAEGDAAGAGGQRQGDQRGRQPVAAHRPATGAAAA